MREHSTILRYFSNSLKAKARAQTSDTSTATPHETRRKMSDATRAKLATAGRRRWANLTEEERAARVLKSRATRARRELAQTNHGRGHSKRLFGNLFVEDDFDEIGF